MPGQMTPHQVNVRNLLALRLAAQIGVPAVLERGKDPAYRLRFNAIAVALAEGMEPEAVADAITRDGAPVASAAALDLEALPYSVAQGGRTDFYYDLLTAQFCTVRRRLYPREVASLRQDGETMRSDPTLADAGLQALADEWLSLKDDEAVEVYLRGVGEAYRNADDLIRVPR